MLMGQVLLAWSRRVSSFQLKCRNALSMARGKTKLVITIAWQIWVSKHQLLRRSMLSLRGGGSADPTWKRLPSLRWVWTAWSRASLLARQTRESELAKEERCKLQELQEQLGKALSRVDDLEMSASRLSDKQRRSRADDVLDELAGYREHIQLPMRRAGTMQAQRGSPGQIANALVSSHARRTTEQILSLRWECLAAKVLEMLRADTVSLQGCAQQERPESGV